MYFDRFDICEAWFFWLQHHWSFGMNNGRDNTYYQRWCKLSEYYNPGMGARDVESENAKEIYKNLCQKEGCTHA